MLGTHFLPTTFDNLAGVIEYTHLFDISYTANNFSFHFGNCTFKISKVHKTRRQAPYQALSSSCHSDPLPILKIVADGVPGEGLSGPLSRIVMVGVLTML